MYPCSYGNYVLLERIGAGGMSEIDLARGAVEDAGFVRFLVIKRVKTERTSDASILRMFKDEARISSELHHSNVAQVYDFGRVGSEYYLVLEYIPGMDLRSILVVLRQRGHFVPLRIALRICVDVLAGLHYAHTKLDTYGRPMGIVHRDVNPRNVMVSTRGEVKLIDFGVAKARDRLERTQTDHVKGKFAYMAPEQMSGQRIDGRADLFAVGLTLHELIAGRSPFVGLTQVQIMHRVLAGQIPPTPVHPDLPDPTALRALQARALTILPTDRFPDAEQYARAIERFAEDHGGVANRTEVAEFLGRVDSTLERTIHERMSRYAGPLLVERAYEPPESPMADDAATAEDPLVVAESAAPAVSASVARTPFSTAGIAAVGGLALLAAFMAIAAAAFLLFVLAATTFGWRVPKP